MENVSNPGTSPVDTQNIPMTPPVPEVQSTTVPLIPLATELTAEERGFLSQFSPEKQEFFLQNRTTMLSMMEPTAEPKAATVAAVPEEPSDGVLKEIFKGGLRIPAQLVTRLANTLGSTVGAGTIDLLDRGFELVGSDLASKETVEAMYQGLPREDQEYLESYFGTVSKPRGSFGSMVSEGGTMVVGAAVMATVMPMMIPAAIASRAATAGSMVAARWKGFGTLASAAQRLFYGFSAASVVGSPETMPEVVAKAWSPKMGQQFIEWYESSPGYVKALLRGTEDLIFGIAGEVLVAKGKKILQSPSVREAVTKFTKRLHEGLAKARTLYGTEVQVKVLAALDSAVKGQTSDVPKVLQESMEKELQASTGKVMDFMGEATKRAEKRELDSIARKMLDAEMTGKTEELEVLKEQASALAERLRGSPDVKIPATPKDAEIAVVKTTESILKESEQKALQRQLLKSHEAAKDARFRGDIPAAETYELRATELAKRLSSEVPQSTPVPVLPIVQPTDVTTVITKVKEGRKAAKAAVPEAVAEIPPVPVVKPPTEGPVAEVVTKIKSAAEIEVAEADVLKRTLLSSQKITKTISKTTVKEVPAATVPSVTSEAAKFQGITKDTLTKMRLEVTGNNPYLVKLGKGAWVEAPNQVVADVVSVTTKETPNEALIAAVKRAHGLSDEEFQSIAAEWGKKLRPLKTKGKWIDGKGLDGKTGEVLEKRFSSFVTRRKGSSLPLLMGELGYVAVSKAAEVFGMPLLGTTMVLVGDLFGDAEVDLSAEEYMGILGTLVGAKYLKSEVLQRLGRFVPEIRDKVLEGISKDNYNVVSLLKTFDTDAIRKGDDTSLKALVTTMSSDLLGKSKEKAEGWLKNITKKVAVGSDGFDEEKLFDHLLTPEAATSILNGTIKGTPKVVSEFNFLSPQMLERSILSGLDAMGDITRNIDFSDTARSNLQSRFNNMLKDYGIPAEAAETWFYGAGKSAEGQMAALTILDSVEQYVLGGIRELTKEAPETRGIKWAGAMAHKLSELRMFHAFLRQPVGMVDDTFESIVKSKDIALAIGEIPERIIGKIEGTYLKRYIDGMQKVATLVSQHFNAKGDEVLPEGVSRGQFLSWITTMGKHSGAGASAMSASYNLMLSNPALWTASFASNMTSLGVEAAQKVTLGMMGVVLGEDSWVAGTAGYFRGFGSAFSQAYDLAIKAAKTGEKLFDPIAEKAIYSGTNVMNIAAAMGGEHLANGFERAFQRLGESFGPTPAGIMKAIDVFTQVLSFNGNFNERLYREAQSRVTEGLTFQQSLDALTSGDESMQKVLLKIAEEALDASRSAAFLRATKTPAISGTRVVDSTDIVGQAIDALAVIQQNPIVRLAEPMFQTGAFAWHRGMLNSPFAVAFDLLKGKSGLMFNTLANATTWSSLSEAAQQEYKLALGEMGSRVIAGSMIGLGIWGAIQASGGVYVNPAASLDDEAKNLGVQPGDIYYPGTGNVIRMSTYDNLAPAVVFFDSLSVLSSTSAQDERVAEHGRNAALALEMILSPMKGVSRLVKTLGRLQSTTDQEGSKIAEFFVEYFHEAFDRFTSPRFTGSIRDWYNGYKTERSHTIAQILEKREAAIDILGRPMETQTPSAGAFLMGFGSQGKVPTDMLSKEFASLNIPLRPPVEKFAGVELTDQKLIRDLRRLRGDLVSRDGTNFLEAQAERRKIPGYPLDKLKQYARKFLNSKSDEATAELSDRILEHLRNRGIEP